MAAVDAGRVINPLLAQGQLQGSVARGLGAGVSEELIYDQQGGTNKLTFSALEQNRGVDDSKFKFTPPAGTKILGAPKP